MNCCEALNALSFKWSSLDETSGPRQQPETISLITYSHNPLLIHCMNCCNALDALSFKWSSWYQASGPRQQPKTI